MMVSSATDPHDSEAQMQHVQGTESSGSSGAPIAKEEKPVSEQESSPLAEIADVVNDNDNESELNAFVVDQEPTPFVSTTASKGDEEGEASQTEGDESVSGAAAPAETVSLKAALAAAKALALKRAQEKEKDTAATTSSNGSRSRSRSRSSSGSRSRSRSPSNAGKKHSASGNNNASRSRSRSQSPPPRSANSLGNRRRSRSPRGSHHYSDSHNQNSSHQRGSGQRKSSTSTGGAGDNIIDEFRVPAKLVGLIIGRGGEQLRRLERTAACRISVSQIDIPGPITERAITVEGSREKILHAKRMIQEIMDNSREAQQALQQNQQQRHGNQSSHSNNNRAHGNNAFVPQKQYPGQDSATHMVPVSRLGLVIGKSGENLKSMIERSGAMIRVRPDRDSDLSQPNREVTLSGTPDAIQRARELIDEVVYHGKHAENERPRQYMGIVPGQQGVPMQQQYNQRYNNQQQQQQEQPALAPGMPPSRLDSQSFAAQAAQAAAGGAGDVWDLLVPNEMAGALIGKGGETVKLLQNESGARIFIDPPNAALPTRTVHLKGNREVVLGAKRLVTTKLLEWEGRNGSEGKLARLNAGLLNGTIVVKPVNPILNNVPEGVLPPQNGNPADYPGAPTNISSSSSQHHLPNPYMHPQQQQQQHHGNASFNYPGGAGGAAGGFNGFNAMMQPPSSQQQQQQQQMFGNMQMPPLGMPYGMMMPPPPPQQLHQNMSNYQQNSSAAYDKYFESMKNSAVGATQGNPSAAAVAANLAALDPATIQSLTAALSAAQNKPSGANLNALQPQQQQQNDLTKMYQNYYAQQQGPSSTSSSAAAGAGAGAGASGINNGARQFPRTSPPAQNPQQHMAKSAGGPGGINNNNNNAGGQADYSAYYQMYYGAK